MKQLNLKIVLMTAFMSFGLITPGYAHHSFAMYDRNLAYVFTGVVTRVAPDPAHLQIFFVPLNEARDTVVRDEEGEPIQWAVEMLDAARIAQQGVTVNNFPPGTIISIGLHPLRNGRPAGGRGDSGLYKCPADTPPAAGMHCDSVEGATKHGPGELEAHGEHPYSD